MKTNATKWLTPEACIETMQRFWREQVAAKATPAGVVLSLPLMYPDGLQVQVRIDAVTPSAAIITDNGRTLARLSETGLNLNAEETASWLEERRNIFELEQDGFELRKQIRLPLDGIDVQLFGEALVSISHLLYRFEPTTRETSPADRAVLQVFQAHRVEPETNVPLDGKIEKGIRVDYLLRRREALARKVVRRRGSMLAYMEQWGFRWNDLKQRNPNLIRSMVYDPEKQNWDDTTIAIAQEVCEVFCPYFDTKALDEAVERTLASCS